MCDRAERLAEAIKNAPLPCPVDGCEQMVTVRYVQVNIPIDPDEWDMEIDGPCLENPDEQHKADYFCLGGSDWAEDWLAEAYMERATMVRGCLEALDQS